MKISVFLCVSLIMCDCDMPSAEHVILSVRMQEGIKA